MRICFFGYINIAKKEGASLSLLNVMEEMVCRGNEVYYVATSGDIIPQLEERGIQCTTILSYTMRRSENEAGIKNTIKYLLKSLVNWWAIIQGKKKLRKYNFDVIHINGIDNHVGASIASALKIPYFWHIRQFLQEDLGKRLVREEVVLKYLKKADGVIGISKAVQYKYETLLQRPVKVIYNGIPLRNYELGTVSRFENQKIQILLAGRITENKGQMEAVRALGLLKEKGICNIAMTLVGNAEPIYLSHIQQEIKKNSLQEMVTVLDYCDDLNELRRKSDIGLVCSKNEAFGRVTIEYMCAEMLVIGANTGGTLELIEDRRTGLLYKQGNAQSLAEKLEYALCHIEDMKKIAKAGKDYALNSFSIERVCDEILEFYAHPYQGDSQ